MCNYPPVLSKADFVRRFMAHEFGNKGPNWDTLEELVKSGYKGLVHVRSRQAGGPGWYNVLPEDVGKVINLHHCTAKSHYLAGMAPTEQTLFQGEVQQTERGLDLFYSTVPKPMRDSLKEGGVQAYGTMAVALLRHYLCPKSLDWMYVLFERYPLHVIEFSTYGCNWGTVPGMNTVIWEVRRY